jgi:perosamine synthetase
MINIFNTYISPEASQKVSEVINSGFLSEGRLVMEFEEKLKKEFLFKSVSTLNSGTSSLHLALDVLGVKEGDEVIIPAQTFVATGLAVLYQKATPIFADINYEDGNIDVADVSRKITSNTKAIICVDWGGYPCDLNELKLLCNKHNISLVEDAAHALGATYFNEPVGSISDLTCFSFQSIKHLTTGDGGAITSNNKALMDQVVEKRWFGINRATAAVSELGERQYNIKAIGYKYHMNDYAAALGLANLVNYSERLMSRRATGDFYRTQLSGVDGIELFKNEPFKQSAYWLFGMHVKNRSSFINHLKNNGIQASVVHQRIDRNSVFGGIKNLPVQEQFDLTQVHIPIHDRINIEKASYIVDVIKKGW